MSRFLFHRAICYATVFAGIASFVFPAHADVEVVLSVLSDPVPAAALTAIASLPPGSWLVACAEGVRAFVLRESASVTYLFPDPGVPLVPTSARSTPRRRVRTTRSHTTSR